MNLWQLSRRVVMCEMCTCDPSGAVSRATRNRHKVMWSACMQWSIALTVRSQAIGAPVSWAVGCRVLVLRVLVPLVPGQDPKRRTGCCYTARGSNELRSRITERAHTRGSRLNASSVDYVHRGSRVLTARVSASDWEPSGGRPPAPAPPLAAHFLRWMTIMEDVQLARKPNNMNHCIRVQPRPSPVRETPVRASERLIFAHG